MTTPDDELDRLESVILAAMNNPATTDQIPDWSCAEDLTRIGIEALLDPDPFGRRLASHGNIRITGDGVTGSSARVSEVAHVMTGFQRLTTAVGAAHTGDKTLGKKPNAHVSRRTDLLLTAAPSVGSIVLTVTPAVAPIDEVGQPGMIEELETDNQMLDTAIGSTIDVFAAGNEIGPNPDDSDFVGQLTTMGPRAAAAIRDLARTLDRARFDIDINWQQPAHATRHVQVTAAAASYIADIVEHANLDEQTVNIAGEYLTVSSVASWLIQQDDGEVISVKRGRIGSDQIKGLAVGDRVRIHAVMKTESVPGGAIKTTYTAQGFERLDPAT